jgi:hypothetical protein
MGETCNIVKERIKISKKKKLVIIFLTIVAIAIPTIALAKSQTQKQKETKIVTVKRTPIEPLKAPEPIKPIPEPPIIVQPTPVVAPTGTCAEWMTQAGITDPGNAIILINRESGCNPSATNRSSGAYGIPQSLPGSKMASAGADWQTNPVTQLRWMQGYVIARYGSWAGAVGFSNTHGWY